MTKADAVEIDFALEAGEILTVRLELERPGGAEKPRPLSRRHPGRGQPAGGRSVFRAHRRGRPVPPEVRGRHAGPTHRDRRPHHQDANSSRATQATIDAHNAKLTDDPMTGVLGELGFGTQVLPVSRRRHPGRKGARHLPSRHRPRRPSRRPHHAGPVQAPAKCHARRHPLRPAQDAELRHQAGRGCTATARRRCSSSISNRSACLQAALEG